ncbi:OsmC family protein [Azohydromonas caseinilytica]|uniref:OsmC family protein n=1 Tax=Azohydromonas caseinilytica TaxID=2728836 RepID=A0A848FIZ2_9BURK|nr:OsmC family protein [Azohydromonas caseinilytica]NML18865.1 OsmC family protein [Azohydromonas caseinilytica]
MTAPAPLLCRPGGNLAPAFLDNALGALGASLTRTTLALAAERGIRVEAVQVSLGGQQEPSARHHHTRAPAGPTQWWVVLHIESPASRAEIEALHAAVEHACPVLNRLRQAWALPIELRHVPFDPLYTEACARAA